MMIAIVRPEQPKNDPVLNGFRIAEKTTIGRYDTII